MDWLADGAAGGRDGGVAVAGGGGQRDRAVGMADGAPAPGRGVLDDVVVLAVRREPGEAGGAVAGERGEVVAVAVAGGAVAAGPGADGVAGEQGLGDEGTGIVAGGGGFEYGAIDRVGEESPPRPVGGDAAGHVGGDRAVAGEFGGVVVEAEQGGGRDDDLDVGAAAVLVGETTAQPVQAVVEDVLEQVRGHIGAPLLGGPGILHHTISRAGSGGDRGAAVLGSTVRSGIRGRHGVRWHGVR